MVLVAAGAIGMVMPPWVIGILAVNGGAERCRRRSVAVAGERSAWNWRGNVG